MAHAAQRAVLTAIRKQDRHADAAFAGGGQGLNRRLCARVCLVVATVLTVVSGWDYLRGTLPLLLGRRG